MGEAFFGVIEGWLGLGKRGWAWEKFLNVGWSLLSLGETGQG